MIYKYLILIAYFSVCRAANYRLVTYVYTIHQSNFDINGKSDCNLFTETSFETIKVNSPGARCTAGSDHVHCIIDNPITCTDLATMCKGNLIGGRCGNQEVKIQQCCYGLIDLGGTGIKESTEPCNPGCFGLKDFGSYYHACKTCGCYHGRTISKDDC
jgi:hypothetical protein